MCEQGDDQPAPLACEDATGCQWFKRPELALVARLVWAKGHASPDGQASLTQGSPDSDS